MQHKKNWHLYRDMLLLCCYKLCKEVKWQEGEIRSMWHRIPHLNSLNSGSILTREPIRHRKDQEDSISAAEIVSVKLAPRNALEASGLSDFGNFW